VFHQFAGVEHPRWQFSNTKWGKSVTKLKIKINSRAKGCRGEREACELLRSHGITARRGQQFKGSPDSPDVVSGLAGYHLEVKRTESFNAYKALEQALADKGEGEAPLVLHKRNSKPWLVIMLADDVLPMLREKAAEKAVEEFLDV